MPAVSAAEKAPAVPEQTSVDEYQQSPATVRFRRWTAFGGTAYLRGQEAGFSATEAAILERQGVGDIIHRRDAASRMVVK